MLLKVNGRQKFFERLSDLTKVRPGEYTVLRYGVEYRIEGGREAGGSTHEWFLDGPAFNSSIGCTSLMDALRLLEGM